MLRWLIGIILGEIICKSSNWQHIQRLKITILGENWQLFRLERNAKCSYVILLAQNIKFYWFVMKIKKFLLPIWWYNRGLFPLGNKYFGVFVLNGLKKENIFTNILISTKPPCQAIFRWQEIFCIENDTQASWTSAHLVYCQLWWFHDCILENKWIA